MLAPRLIQISLGRLLSKYQSSWSKKSSKMKIFILIFLFGLSSDFLLSQELFRGENLLVKPPKISEYKGFHKESGGLKSTTWISNENGTKDTHCEYIKRKSP